MNDCNFIVFAISTHSSRTGGDAADAIRALLSCQFQPTPPAREETRRAVSHRNARADFNPLLPHGRRH